MVAIVENDAERATVNLDRLLAADIAPTAKIVAHIKGLIETYFERPYLHRLLQKLLREGSAEASGKVGIRFVQPVAAARRTIVAEGIRRGDFRTDIAAGLVGFAIDGARAQIFSSVDSLRVLVGHRALARLLGDSYIQ